MAKFRLNAAEYRLKTARKAGGLAWDNMVNLGLKGGNYEDPQMLVIRQALHAAKSDMIAAEEEVKAARRAMAAMAAQEAEADQEAKELAERKMIRLKAVEKMRENGEFHHEAARETKTKAAQEAKAAQDATKRGQDKAVEADEEGRVESKFVMAEKAAH